MFGTPDWAVPLKDKKGITISNAFQKNLYESKSDGHKPSMILVYKGNEFYNRLMKSWLHDNNKEIYSTRNEEKSFIIERIIRTLRIKSTSI